MMISAGPTLASRQSPTMMQHRSPMAGYHHTHYHHHSGHNGMQEAYGYMSQAAQHYHPQSSPSLGSTPNMSLSIPRTAPSLSHHQHQQHHHHASAIVPKTEPRDPLPLHPIMPTSPVIEHNYEVGGQLSTNGFPTRQQFDQLLNDYILSLSPKKRDKALIPQKRYGNILAVLKEPKCTTIESAQFRFWVKKMFRLGTDCNGDKIVLHEGKPVAVRETLYDVLTNSHSQAQHGGRDKTSAKVRDRYSWSVVSRILTNQSFAFANRVYCRVPKELIARFVRNCPTCTLRRSNPVEFSASVSNSTSALSSRSQSFDANSAFTDFSTSHNMDQKMPPSSMAPLPPLERSMSYTYPMDVHPSGYIQMSPEHCHIDARMYTTHGGRNSV
ncbi:hypothetical protein BJ508DRAFT_43733 [Ascobolus immersus RN42]|uniref:Integrase zinc-binding domain-containing protein n=1 Tax=Ascobolus immersus RN42 TaxID=1160509 RepID=A0A3N4IDQ4_ASCIM|nr:hypothetical protein BJ508DRAFT_43733 [Ascobolus immersus RN42]